MAKRSLQARTAPRGTSVVAAGFAVIAVTYGMLRFGFGLHLPALARELDVGPATAGGLASGTFLSYCAAALMARPLVARGRARLVLRAGAAAGAGGALVVTAAASTPTLMAGVLLAGSAAGAVSPALVEAVGSSLPGPLLDRAQGVVNGGTGAGVAVAGLGVLLRPDAWRASWVLAAVLVVLAAVVVDRRASWDGAAGPPARAEMPTAAAGDSRPGWAPVRATAAAVVAGTGSAAVWTFGRELLTDVGGLDDRTSALAWVVLGAAAVLGAASGGLVRLIGVRAAWATTAVGACLGSLVLGLLPGHAVPATLAGALFAGAYTALSGVLISWAARLDPDAPGRTTATLFIALAAGQALGAAVAGALVDELGLVTVVVGSAGVLAIAAGLAPARSSARLG